MNYIIETTRSLEKVFFWGGAPSATVVPSIASKNFTYWGDSPEMVLIGQEEMSLTPVIAIAINMEVILTTMSIQLSQNVPLFRDVISNLLENRDFLGYQLSFCKGNLTEEQFLDIKKKYLKPNNIYDVDTLADDVFLLMKNTSRLFDADEISTMLNCDIDVAEEAITKIIDIY